MTTSINALPTHQPSAPHARQAPPRLIHAVLIVTIILEPLLELPAQPPLLVDQTAPLLQGLPATVIDGIKADHALALGVVEVRGVVVVDVDGGLAGPGRGQEEGVQGVG